MAGRFLDSLHALDIGNVERALRLLVAEMGDDDLEFQDLQDQIDALSPGGGADIHLGNLDDTAINTDLRPDDDLSINLGAQNKRFIATYTSAVKDGNDRSAMDVDGRELYNSAGDLVLEFNDDDIKLPNNKLLRTHNFDNTDSPKLIYMDVDNVTHIGDDSYDASLSANTLNISSNNGNDLNIGANGGGSLNLGVESGSAITLDATDGGGTINLFADVTLLINNSTLRWQNAANDDVISLVQLDSSDTAQFGDSPTATSLNGLSILLRTFDGGDIHIVPDGGGKICLDKQVVMPNSVNFFARNAADTADISLFFVNGTDGIYIGDPSAGVTLYADSVSMLVNSSGSGLAYVQGNGAAASLVFLDDTNGGYIGFKAPASVPANLVWILPDSDGTLNQALVTDGAGNLSWMTMSGGGATTALDNLAATAINAHLLPDSANTRNLGSDTLPFFFSYEVNVNTTLIEGWSNQTLDFTTFAYGQLAFDGPYSEDVSLVSLNNGVNTRGIGIRSANNPSGDSKDILITSGTASGNRGVVELDGRSINMLNLTKLYMVGSDPAGGEEGHVYYNSTAKKIKFYNGTAWETVTSL